MKKYRILTFVLILVLIVASFSKQAQAAVSETNVSEVEISREDYVYKSQALACKALRNGIYNRIKENSSFAADFYMTVSFKTTKYNSSTFCDDFKKELFKYDSSWSNSLKSVYSDSLRLGIKQLCVSKIKATKKTDSTGTYYVIKVCVYGNYFLSKEQDSFMINWVNANYKKIVVGKNDYQKSLAAYRWIIKNSKYAFYKEDGREVYNTAYGPIVGYGVCRGFSHLYYMLLNRAGIPCRVVVDSTHAWNIIKLDGKWYIADVTFGLDGSKASESKFFAVGSTRYEKQNGRNTTLYGGNITVSKTDYLIAVHN